MNEDNTKLEFRLVQGMQAGASMPLLRKEYVIGSARDCDIVLLGALIAPEHARITLLERGFKIELLNGTCKILGQGTIQGTEDIFLGQLIRLGSVCFTIDSVLMPWPSQDRVTEEEKGVKHIYATQEESKPDWIDRLPIFVEKFLYQAVQYRLLGIILVTLPLMGYGGYLAYQGYRTHLMINAPKIVIVHERPEFNIQDRIKQVFKKNNVVKTNYTIEKQGVQYIVKGYVTTKAISTKISRDISSIRARITVSIFNDQDMQKRFKHYLNKNIQHKLYVGPMMHGDIVIDAIGLTKREKNKILETKILVNGIRNVKINSVTLKYFEEEIKKSIKEKKLSSKVLIKTINKTTQIVASGHVDAIDMKNWNIIVSDYKKKYGKIDALVSHVIQTTKLPFQIVAIMTGSTPFVVTATGERLMPGSIKNGVKLMSITDNGAIFEQDGRRISIP